MCQNQYHYYDFVDNNVHQIDSIVRNHMLIPGWESESHQIGLNL